MMNLQRRTCTRSCLKRAGNWKTSRISKMFEDDGKKPVRACGSRWVSHKQNAMKRVLSKFGACTARISAISNTSVKSTNCSKLAGYLKNKIG